MKVEKLKTHHTQIIKESVSLFRELVESSNGFKFSKDDLDSVVVEVISDIESNKLNVIVYEVRPDGRISGIETSTNCNYNFSFSDISNMQDKIELLTLIENWQGILEESKTNLFHLYGYTHDLYMRCHTDQIDDFNHILKTIESIIQNQKTLI